MQEKQNLNGGVGSGVIYHILSEKEINDNIRMFAKVVLKPGASIGWHQHTGETEPYYILEGNGIFSDNDKTKTNVKAGDVCLIENMQYHSIENLSKEDDLSFIALIYKVADAGGVN